MSAVIATARPSLITRSVNAVRSVYNGLDLLSPVADLIVRLWVAKVFFSSGLVKIQSLDSTILLFTYEYHVPFLPPVAAAYMGTFTELFFPVLLAFGLAGRFAAFVLFVFNIIAAISYPELMGPGIRDHQVWGIMLLVTLLHGPGKISLDHLIGRKFGFGSRV